MVISGLLPLPVGGTDARECGNRRLVQHLYSALEGLAWAVSPIYAAGHGDLISPVLPGGQGDGVAGRAVDAADRPRTGRRQRAFQRAAARRATDVADPAVQAAQSAGPGGSGGPARRRERRAVPPDVRRPRAPAGS